MRDAASTEARFVEPAVTHLPPPTPASASYGWVAALRNFARQPLAFAQCDLCKAPIADVHAHVVELAQHRVACACRACIASLEDGALSALSPAPRYRRVPDRAERLAGFVLSDAQWARFGLPIDLAFFVRSTADDRVQALYPSPAGAVRSQLELEAWSELAAVNPVLDSLAPDVEALIVNRSGGARDYYRAPIDQCYALVAVIRARWTGVSGGAGLRLAIEEFFAALSDGARPSFAGFHG